MRVCVLIKLWHIQNGILCPRSVHAVFGLFQWKIHQVASVLNDDINASWNVPFWIVLNRQIFSAKKPSLIYYLISVGIVCLIRLKNGNDSPIYESIEIVRLEMVMHVWCAQFLCSRLSKCHRWMVTLMNLRLSYLLNLLLEEQNQFESSGIL